MRPAFVKVRFDHFDEFFGFLPREAHYCPIFVLKPIDFLFAFAYYTP